MIFQPGEVTLFGLCCLSAEITSLVTDMHACADKIIDLFNGKTSADGQAVSEESLMTNPAKLCYVVKQGLREAAVGE